MKNDISKTSMKRNIDYVTSKNTIQMTGKLLRSLPLKTKEPESDHKVTFQKLYEKLIKCQLNEGLQDFHQLCYLNSGH